MRQYSLSIVVDMFTRIIPGLMQAADSAALAITTERFVIWALNDPIALFRLVTGLMALIPWDKSDFAQKLFMVANFALGITLTHSKVSLSSRRSVALVDERLSTQSMSGR